MPHQVRPSKRRLSAPGWVSSPAALPPRAAFFHLSLLVATAFGACSSRSAQHTNDCPKCPQTTGGEAAQPNPRGDSGPETDPPGDAGSGLARRAQPFTLAAAAEGFRSHAECVAELTASLPPELSAEADPANMAERICQTRRALAEKSVSLCDEIQDAAWPGACRRLLAGLYGRPEACPTLTPRSLGREPACLALASRDASLCRAAEKTADRLRCLAILGPPGGCQALRTSADVAACERDRRRWRAVIQLAQTAKDPATAPAPQGPNRPGPQDEPELSLEVTYGGRTQPLRLQGASRGIVVPWESSGRTQVSIGALPSLETISPGEDRLRVVLEVPRLELPSVLDLGAEASGAAGSSGRGPGDEPGMGEKDPSTRTAPLPREAPMRQAGEARPPEVAPRAPADGRLRPGAMTKTGQPERPASALSLPSPDSADMAASPKGEPTSPEGSAKSVAVAARGRARLCIIWKGEPIPLSAVKGQVSLGPILARRGAEATGTIEASFTAGSETVRLKGRLRTYVRDVVPSDWLTGSCAETLAQRSTRPPKAHDAPQRPGTEDRPPCYFVAHWDGLARAGYRAYGIRAGEACDLLGLRENDVVTAVGGKTLGTWADVTELYRRLRTGRPMELTVKRGGRSLTLRRR